MTRAAGPSEKIQWRWPLVVAAVGVLAYANTIPNGFTLDDIPMVRDNPEIVAVAGIPSQFSKPYWPGEVASGLYRPITISSYAINRALTGPGAAGFHAVNALLHGLVCLAVWFVARRAGTHYGTALLAGLLFAVHPIHTEAVANIVGRAELLAALGVLVAWIAHRRASEAAPGRARVGWAVSAAAYLLAVLSKEHAIVAPALFVFDDLLIAKGEGEPAVRVFRPTRYLPYVAAIVIAVALRTAALGGLRGAETAAFIDNPAVAAGAWTRGATAVWVHARYVWLMLWPARLSSDYSFDAIPVVDSAFDPRFLIGCGLTIGLMLLGWWGWRRQRTVALGVCVWLLFWLPAGNLLFPAGTVMGERLIYLSSLGLCLLAAHATVKAVNQPGLRVAVLVAVAIALTALSARTFTRNPDWDDNLTLALADLRAEPRSAKLHAGAAIELHDAGEIERAREQYEKALRIYPDYAQMHYNYGVLLEPRWPQEAIRHYRRAAELSPANPLPRKALARLLATSAPP